MIVFIDCGGTPEYVLLRDKTSFLTKKGVPKEKIIVLLDPFDLSRKTRTWVLGKDLGKIKISTDVKNTAMTSSRAGFDKNKLEKDLQSKGLENFNGVLETKNIREAMNFIVRTMLPKKINAIETEKIIDKKTIPENARVRFACPKCGLFSWNTYSEKNKCCCIPASEAEEIILEKGLLREMLVKKGICIFENLEEPLNTMFENYISEQNG